MSKLDPKVKELINAMRPAIFATADPETGAPNASVIMFKMANDNDQIVLCNVFMNKAVKNLEKNPLVSITVYNQETMEGYQVKGKATYTTDPAAVAKGNEATGPRGLTTKGMVIVEPIETYILSPGPNCGQLI